jgi:hypothetical protein
MEDTRHEMNKLIILLVTFPSDFYDKLMLIIPVVRNSK